MNAVPDANKKMLMRYTTKKREGAVMAPPDKKKNTKKTTRFSIKLRRVVSAEARITNSLGKYTFFIILPFACIAYIAFTVASAKKPQRMIPKSKKR